MTTTANETATTERAERRRKPTQAGRTLTTTPAAAKIGLVFLQPRRSC